MVFVKFLDFLRSFKPMSSLVAVLSQIMLDSRAFLALLFVLLLGFGTAFFALGPNTNDPDQNGNYFQGMAVAIYSTWAMGIMGEDQIDQFTAMDAWAKIVQIACCMGVVVVLLNLLIAIRAGIIYQQNLVMDVIAHLVPCLRESGDVRWLYVLQQREVKVGELQEDDAWKPKTTVEQSRWQSNAVQLKELAAMMRNAGRNTKACRKKIIKLEARLAELTTTGPNSPPSDQEDDDY
eukprot:g4516.t1